LGCDLSSHECGFGNWGGFGNGGGDNTLRSIRNIDNGIGLISASFAQVGQIGLQRLSSDVEIRRPATTGTGFGHLSEFPASDTRFDVVANSEGTQFRIDLIEFGNGEGSTGELDSSLRATDGVFGSIHFVLLFFNCLFFVFDCYFNLDKDDILRIIKSQAFIF
jgi:hypothetical protein